MLVALVGGLAASIFVQWYQTWHEEKVWRREQYVLELQRTFDRALEANTAVEEMFWTTTQVQRAFDADVTAAAHAKSALGASKQEGRPIPASLVMTDKTSEALHAREVQSAKLLMLLFQAGMLDAAAKDPKPDPDVLTAYREWENADDAALAAYLKLSEARQLDRAPPPGLRQTRDETAARAADAREQLTKTIRVACIRAAMRLHSFRKYGTGLQGDREPLDPLLPWVP